MEIKKRVLALKFEGKEYSVSYPTVRQLRELTVKKEGESDLDMTLRFLEELGLPKDVVEDMESENITEIINVLTSQKKS